MSPYSQKILATLLRCHDLLPQPFCAQDIEQFPSPSHPNAVDSLVSRLFFCTGRLGMRLHPCTVGDQHLHLPMWFMECSYTVFKFSVFHTESPDRNMWSIPCIHCGWSVQWNNE